MALPRVLIVAENASTQFGGEAILPWHYFRILRKRGVEAWLIAHQRTRQELLGLLPDEASRMYFIPDSLLNKIAWQIGRRLPARIADMSVGYLSRLSTQWAARKLARRLVAALAIDVVHQPIPVSPREPSLLDRLGAPVVIGPMNGNMSFPPAFARQAQARWIDSTIALGRLASTTLHHLIPGKLHAAALLVANVRTQAALPQGTRGQLVMLTENGVDLELWTPRQQASRDGQPITFLFMGRLVDWKAVDLLLDGFAQLDAALRIKLEIVGDGPKRAALEAQSQRLGLQDKVHFIGWQAQQRCAELLREADALVLPSLYECGGAVVLEAMACALPVIATDWGGPADYLDSSCGILVAPTSRTALTNGLTRAMTRLASSAALRNQLGQAGRARVEAGFDWEIKIDQMMQVYQQATANKQRPLK